MNESSFTNRSVKWAVATVFTLAALVSLWVLLKPEPRVAATNSVGVPAWAIVHFSAEDGELCALNQYIPAGVGGVRIYVGTYMRPGPMTSVQVRTADDKLLAKGSLAGYDDGKHTSIKVSPALERTVPDAKTCVSIDGGEVALGGTPGTDPDSGLELEGKEIGMDFNVSYMTADSKPLIGELPKIFARAALFRPGWQGSWVFYLLLVLVPAVAAGAAVAMVRAIKSPEGYDTRRWAIAITLLVAFNALAWSIVAPIFLPPDEVGHYAFVEGMAQSDTLPSRDPKKGGYGAYGNHQALAVRYVAVNIVLNEDGKLPWSRTTYDEWHQQDAALPDLGKAQGGGWTSAAGYTPIYYAPATLVWHAAGDATVFTKAWLLRLWSVLLTTIAGLFCFLFARELLPSIRWAAPVAGLSVAFLPMFLHIGSTVNNDALLFACGSALMYLLARSFRRGAGPGMAALIAAVLALGILAKPTMMGFLPAVAIGLGLGLWKGWREGKTLLRQGLISPGVALFTGAAVLAAYYVPSAGGDSAAGAAALAGSDDFSWVEFAQFIWQWYLPEAPGMTAVPTTEGIPVVRVFIRGFFADFNSLDTNFADGWYAVMTAIFLVLVGGLIAWGVRSRDRWREWWGPFGICAGAVAGTLFLIHFRSYLQVIYDGTPFSQGRYLLVLASVFGVGIVAAAQGFKRWAPAVAASVVSMLIVLNAFGMMLSMLRFYA